MVYTGRMVKIKGRVRSEIYNGNIWSFLNKYYSLPIKYRQTVSSPLMFPLPSDHLSVASNMQQTIYFIMVFIMDRFGHPIPLDKEDIIQLLTESSYTVFQEFNLIRNWVISCFMWVTRVPWKRVLLTKKLP